MKKLLAPIALAVALVVSGSARAADEDDLRGVLKKAIEAHGGAAKLDKYLAFEQSFKGKINLDGMLVDFTMKMWGEAPDKQKEQISFSINGMQFTMVRSISGNSGWMSLNGMVSDVPKEELEQAKHDRRAGFLSGQLTPLLGKKYKLSAMGAKKIGGKEAIGILVKEKGQEDLSLYFDKKTHLLIGLEHSVKDANTGGEEQTQSLIFADYKKDAKTGVMVPMSVTIKREGKEFISGKVTESTLSEKLAKSVFAKPD